MLKKKEDKAKKKGLDAPTPRRRIWWALGFAVLGFVILVALAYYKPAQCIEVKDPPESGNPLGQGGALSVFYLSAWLGVTAWCVPWLLFTAAYVCFADLSRRSVVLKMLSVLVFSFSLSILADAYQEDSGKGPSVDQTYHKGAGGTLGGFLYSGMIDKKVIAGGFLKGWIGPFGTGVVMSALLLGSLAVYLSARPNAWFDKACKVGGRLGDKLREQRAEAKKMIQKDEAKAKPNQETPKHPFAEEDTLFGHVEPNLEANGKNKTASKRKAGKVAEKAAVTEEVFEETESKPEEKESSETEVESEPESDEDDMGGFKIVRSEQTTKARDLFPERQGDYHFPPLDLLMDPPELIDGGDEDHMKKAQNLRNTLAEFKIEVELGEVHTGPVITRYDVHPAPGVRVEKIANLDKNLSMALKAESVRILAPVPGRGCVGIEVPNAVSSPVCIKEILESTAWADINAEIPIVLGKVASGKPLVADLTKMPHLLIAGSTGSGKTVCMNAIIASLCYHSSPEDIRFIMVDPKIVEMKVYNDLPHMLIPVVTDPKKVPAALKWLLMEMERRYQIFATVGVRNLAGFNAKILKDKEEKAKADALDAELSPEERAALSSVEVPRDEGVLEIPEGKLPYIVCIIDELADLMMVAQAEVETGIARLAQLARAAGIHLIIATQRPSVNVITGVIKANLPSRISFRVASLMDSRTILDGKGAEALIGRGDMLFIPPGSATFLRAQGAFVSDDEINGIVDFLKRNGPPDIVEAVQEQIESASEEDILGGDSDDDPMLAKALEVIRTTKRASTSNLQRKLKIGYNRAARIMDELEERGIVGSDNGAQPREILKDFDGL